MKVAPNVVRYVYSRVLFLDLCADLELCADLAKLSPVSHTLHREEGEGCGLRDYAEL